MTRITFEDLPEELKISKDEMRKVLGGAYQMSMPSYWTGIGGTLLADPRPSPLKLRGITDPLGKKL